MDDLLNEQRKEFNYITQMNPLELNFKISSQAVEYATNQIENLIEEKKEASDGAMKSNSYGYQLTKL